MYIHDDLWQYGLWSFQTGVTKLERFLNFENWTNGKHQVLYMSFDKLLLVVESRDLSQADKSIKRVSSFPKLSKG